ncbi:MAG TPA: hypothetical protein VFL10_01630 [Ornithinibacter sp.]|nr:hypothetical protein [Ornithinibacter sp.]
MDPHDGLQAPEAVPPGNNTKLREVALRVIESGAVLGDPTPLS